MTGRPGAPAGEWPSEGLERASACPLCGMPQRSLFLDDLADTAFQTAPGRWTLWRCEGCGGGYLDPRPTAATIHRAYESYYTHAAGTDGRSRPVVRQRLLGYARRSYLRRHHGAGGVPGDWIAPLFAAARPSLAQSLDYSARYLPPVRAGEAPRVLDVGCGGGEFLRLAMACGWRGFGCDFDPVAVERARACGAEVRLGGPEAFAGEAQGFDAVTLNHVIEHVHDPAVMLQAAHDLLRPGGHLFIETPNFEALGLERYGAAWRGLEPPRHLVLFTWPTLTGLLGRCGFAQVAERPQPQVARNIWLKSDRLRSGLDPYDTSSPYSPDALEGLPAPDAIAPRRTEFITLTARRAG